MKLPPHWDPLVQGMNGIPQPAIFIYNLRGQPIGGGVIRLLLMNHVAHGAAWDMMEEHGLGQEVVLLMNQTEYFYYADVGEEDDIFLFPMDDENESLPDDRLFLKRAFHLRLPW
jgi:hypothetical protein